MVNLNLGPIHVKFVKIIFLYFGIHGFVWRYFSSFKFYLDLLFGKI